VKLAVLSGKGGTGKTLVSVNLAAVAKESVYVDCDVEEPNGHLFFKPTDVKTKKVVNKIPVVDEDLLLLGIVTVDDAMDVLTLEESEDLARSGGAEPLGRPYFSVSDFRLAKSRVLWLVVLIVAATLTVQVLNMFESTLETVVSLALFIPLLIGTGGNAGAQSSTTIVRSMAVGDVQPSDFVRTLLREGRVGFLLGAMLGLLSYLPVSLYAGYALALVVSLTLVSICTLASVVGSMMPLAARFFGVDPAVASAPFVTTIVDATGLLVYFMIAKAILNL